jgi:murein DD-endopeptidase MepM/ murein hydrolase activator NlpD
MNSFALGLVIAAVVAIATGQDLTLHARTAEWPVTPATVVRSFEPYQRFGPGHRGVDLAATPNQPVHSALPGVVTFAGRVAGRPVVVVRHSDGLRTTYLPVLPTVRVGDRVVGGEPIGRLATDLHCIQTSCLHWGARRGDTYLDPLTLLPQQVVLLPP